ncbi:hypothetical protein [Microvirga vignae]|uniref:hypothetical protein n=1 Tax=Microvirga vignae TaxID=1225564 RepID=UPI001364D474|nr:hypothetical protein [Microvirga vignae]
MIASSVPSTIRPFKGMLVASQYVSKAEKVRFDISRQARTKNGLNSANTVPAHD